MKKKIAALCFAALLLTACGMSDSAYSATLIEGSDDSVTDALTSIQSEDVSETVSDTETETATEAVTEVRTEVITETETETEAETEPAAVDHKALYKARLMECLAEEADANYAFELYDIDSDGTPELFISEGDYHSGTVNIYCISEGELKKLSCGTLNEYEIHESDQFGSEGCVQISGDGCIKSFYEGMGINNADYYRFENGETTSLLGAHIFTGVPDDPEERFYINANEVSKDDFNEAVKEYDAMEWTDVGRAYPFDKDTINSVLGGEDTVSEAPAAYTSDEYKDIYRDFLMEVTKREGYDPMTDERSFRVTFELLDLDSDGTPELFFSDGKFHLSTLKVYTVCDGKLTEIENPTGLGFIYEENGGFGSDGIAQTAEGGYLLSYFSGTGNTYNDLFRMENGELEYLLCAEHCLWYVDDNGEEREMFAINGTEVTEAEYNEEMEKINALNWNNIGEKYIVSVENINAVLS